MIDALIWRLRSIAIIIRQTHTDADFVHDVPWYRARRDMMLCMFCMVLSVMLCIKCYGAVHSVHAVHGA